MNLKELIQAHLKKTGGNTNYIVEKIEVKRKNHNQYLRVSYNCRLKDGTIYEVDKDIRIEEL